MGNGRAVLLDLGNGPVEGLAWTSASPSDGHQMAEDLDLGGHELFDGRLGCDSCCLLAAVRPAAGHLRFEATANC